MTDAQPVGRVAAVVVVWKSLGSTMQAIESLLAGTVTPDPLICIAQELAESDLELLATVVPGDGLIALQDNIGFASAANLGISRAADLGCDWVFLANNDATFGASCIASCREEAGRYEHVAVVSPAISYSERPNRLWFAGAAQSRLLAVVWHRGYFASASRPPPSSASDFIPSCSALMSVTAWVEVGPMRDDYFMYFEDVDWGERARQRGWQLRYLGEVLASHEMGGSSDHAASRYMSANTTYYLARNPLRFALETPALGLRVSRTFGVGVVWTLYNLTRIRPSDWPTSGRALVQGLLDGWRGRMGRRDLARSEQRHGSQPSTGNERD
jgi:GT2 family glycosyltransferase